MRVPSLIGDKTARNDDLRYSKKARGVTLCDMKGQATSHSGTIIVLGLKLNYRNVSNETCQALIV
jgi:hypothetical protein